MRKYPARRCKMQRRSIPNPEPIVQLTVIESKRKKSRLLANRRAKILIKRMRMTGNLGASHHDLSSEQTEKLIKTLEAEFISMIEALRRKSKFDEITDIL